MLRTAVAAIVAAAALGAGAGHDAGGYVDNTPRPPDLSRCVSLEACLALLDAAAPAEGNGGMDEVAAKSAAAALNRFGEPAKQALLDRAVSPRPGLRNEVGAVLTFWPDWSRADVPRLAAGLRLDHGGWLARPLGEIGGPEAIDVLVADLAVAGAANQTSFALTEIGPEVLPKLLPLLATPEHSPAHEGAAAVIHDMGRAKVAPALPGWVGLAVDASKPRASRLAALAAVGALQDDAQPEVQGTRALLRDPDPAIQRLAREILGEAHDATMAAERVAVCRPVGKPFVPIFPICLDDLVMFRTAPDLVGPRLLDFAGSPNRNEAAQAIRGIGTLAYAPAGPALVAALRSADWGIVHAAATALGQLGPDAPKDAVPALQAIAEEYWFPEVRSRARAALEAIRGGRRLSPLPGEDDAFALPFNMPTEDEEAHPCLDWRWEGRKIGPDPPRTEVATPEGVLTAANHGEWGGSLSWSPRTGRRREFIRDNFGMLDPFDGTSRVLALGGVSHMIPDDSYVVLLESQGAGWTVREIARLPGQFDQLAVVGPDTYAAFGPKRGVVFSRQRVLGLATCVVRDQASDGTSAR